MVKLTLLRLQPFDDQAIKPFGYDLFEGTPSTFAPVSDIQVPMDYLVGPGDTLKVQLYGNEPGDLRLTVERDGRINFPKLGPIMVSGMSFDRARATIEEQRATAADRIPRQCDHGRSALDPCVRIGRGREAGFVHGQRACRR